MKELPDNPFLRALLRVPLFYKILIANAVIVLMGALIGTAVSARYLAGGDGGVSAFGFAVLLALAGVAVTLLVNALILRLALEPLEMLERTAADVQAGDLDCRVPPSAVADAALERLTGTFNGMLDTLESYRQRLRDVAARALNAEEEERKRIARELHDDTAQTLAALLIRLRVARATGEPTMHGRILDEFREELSQALERIRRFAQGLRPPALDELGLVPALEAHVRGLGESPGRVIRMEAEPVGTALGEHAELALYRIAQEALFNAIRHSGAATVELRILRTPTGVRVVVRDDGSGFDAEEVLSREGRGLGLFGMQERAAYVGGRVEIRSSPGRGTKVTAEAPAGGEAAVPRPGDGINDQETIK
jgi:two-component system sensor histidine kinase UhpB